MPKKTHQQEDEKGRVTTVKLGTIGKWQLKYLTYLNQKLYVLGALLRLTFPTYRTKNFTREDELLMESGECWPGQDTYLVEAKGRTLSAYEIHLMRLLRSPTPPQRLEMLGC